MMVEEERNGRICRTDTMMDKMSNADSKAETILFDLGSSADTGTKYHNTPPTRAESCGSYPNRFIARG